MQNKSRTFKLLYIIPLFIALFSFWIFYRYSLEFNLLSVDGLIETDGQILKITQNGNESNVEYIYYVLSELVNSTTYYGYMSITDISPSYLPSEGELVKVEYLPNSPDLSIISKTTFPNFYREQLENAIIKRWLNKLFLPLSTLIFSIILVLFFRWHIRNNMQIESSY